MKISNLHIKQLALNEGFELCSVAKIKNISEHQAYIDEWIYNQYNATMNWFTENRDIRTNPELLLGNAKSIVVCAKYYNPSVDFGRNPRIAKYALSDDYHHTLKQKMRNILPKLDGVNGVCFVDSAPILEKYWAANSGIGWIGKNGLITNSKYGSLINLAIMIMDSEFDVYDNPVESKCGSCNKCREACPTGALLEHVVDCRNCLSYLTIEHKGEFSVNQEDLIRKNNGGMLFGCDRCLDSCVWNSKATTVNGYTHAVDPKFTLSTKQWESMTGSQFNKYYRRTPLHRAGLNSIKRNLKLIL